MPCLTVPSGIWDKYTWEVQLQSFHLICEQRCGRAGNDEPRICNGGRRPNKLLLKAYAGVNPTVPLSLPVSPPAVSLRTSVILICETLVCFTCFARPGSALGRRVFLTLAHVLRRQRTESVLFSVNWVQVCCAGPNVNAPPVPLQIQVSAFGFSERLSCVSHRLTCTSISDKMAAGHVGRQASFDELHFKRFSKQRWDYALHKPLSPTIPASIENPRDSRLSVVHARLLYSNL